MEFSDLWNIKISAEEPEVELIPRETPCATCNSDKYGLYNKFRTVTYIHVPDPLNASYPYEVLVQRATASCPNGCLEHGVPMVYNHETSKWLPEDHEDIKKMLLNDATQNKMLHDNGDHRKCISQRHCYWLQNHYLLPPEKLWKNFVDFALKEEDNGV